MRAGVRTYPFGSENVTAYVVTNNNLTTGSFIDVGDTSVIIQGPLSKDNLGSAIAQLEVR